MAGFIEVIDSSKGTVMYINVAHISWFSDNKICLDTLVVYSVEESYWEIIDLIDEAGG